MKLKSSRRQAPRATPPGSKTVADKPVRRPAPAETPPRVWSLLLPPAFTNDRR
jgi:hypothetical protein